MAIPKMIKRFTVQEYYALETAASYKSDYYKGEIFAMAGGTAEHSRICVNIGGELRNRLRGKPCDTFESKLRLKIKATGLRTYPDVSVYCGPLERAEDDAYHETYTNPTVLFEVLSKSTEGYDRGFKAQNYRRIETLRAYALVSQTDAFIEIYERQPDNRWLLREVAGLDAVLTIPAIGVDVPLSEIYSRVTFTNAEAVTAPVSD
jgi:Uma2 family endonuclease